MLILPLARLFFFNFGLIRVSIRFVVCSVLLAARRAPPNAVSVVAGVGSAAAVAVTAARSRSSVVTLTSFNATFCGDRHNGSRHLNVFALRRIKIRL